MAQHGYLREYDEEGSDRDRGDWRDRSDWRERGERDWSDRDRDYGDRDRGMMFGDRDRGRSGDRGNEGFFSRMRDEGRSWFGDDDERSRQSGRSAWENNRDWPQRDRGTSGYGREHGYGGSQGEYRGAGQQGGFGGSNEWREGGRNYSAHPDDHYRSWRDRQMQSLDRDYQDYCREREQQFHQDFDSWRQTRQQRQGSTGQQQDQQRGQQQLGEQDELVLAERTRGTPDAVNEPIATTPSPEANATLGTNNPENTPTARRRS